MKTPSLLVLALALSVITGHHALADTIYSNGPINGNAEGWNITDLVVSDSFTVTGPSTVSSFDFGAWTFPTDSITNVDWSITSAADGGTSYASSSAASTSDAYKFTSAAGFDIYSDTVNTGAVALGTGTYWLNLTNATTAQGLVGFWDQNSGSSQASQTISGSIPSESFDILGTAGILTAAPEPSPVAAFVVGIGMLGCLALIRRRPVKN